MEKILNVWLRFSDSIKLKSWWNYKIGAGLFTYLLSEIVLYRYIKGINLIEISLLLLVFFFYLLIGFAINDYADYATDIKAGKSNIFNYIPYKWAPVYLSFFYLVGNFLIYKFYSFVVFVLFSVLLLCVLLYSTKPFRLKESKYLSLIITGLYERVIPYTIIIAFISNNLDFYRLKHSFFIVYLLWAFLWECRNFVRGQFIDYNADTVVYIKSFTHHWGIHNSKKWWRILFIAELLSLMLWCALLLFIKPVFIVYFLLIIVVLIFYKLYFYSEHFIKSFSNLMSFIYAFSFLNVLIVFLMATNKIPWYYGVLIIALFRSSYLNLLLKRLYQKILNPGFYLLKGFLSYLVNHTIYYLTKWRKSK